jgi:hypothetical protein
MPRNARRESGCFARLSKKNTPRGVIPLLFDFRICLILHRFEQNHSHDRLIDAMSLVRQAPPQSFQMVKARRA